MDDRRRLNGRRTEKRGQFVLPASPPQQTADALFEQAQAAEETGDVAERLYRLLMKCDPPDAAPPFNLGNMLRYRIEKRHCSRCP
jgi:hypothetical protein